MKVLYTLRNACVNVWKLQERPRVMRRHMHMLILQYLQGSLEPLCLLQKQR